MRLLLDQGIARSTVGRLREMNIASVHVGDLGLAAATDEEILEVGRNGGWVVVTLDADFHAKGKQGHALWSLRSCLSSRRHACTLGRSAWILASWIAFERRL